MSEGVETVVIGGGQAGLAAGYHLAKREWPFVILDANEHVGDSWRHRWDSLRLFTPARYDGLPGFPFPAESWAYPGKDEVADFLEAYAARFDLPVRNGVAVERLSQDGDRFVVTWGDHRLVAHDVVVATGTYHRLRIPAFARDLDPNIRQLGSTEYRDPSQLREGGVLVIGAGNSGAEIAYEVATTHRTWLSGPKTGHIPVRTESAWDRVLTPPFWFVASRLLTVDTPIGRRIRPRAIKTAAPLERVRPKEIAAAGIERVPRTVGVVDGLPALEGGRTIDVANVTWCTGFRPDFGWIDLPVFDEDGEPVHERGVVVDPPGLYFIGRFFLYGFTSSLLGGVGRDAASIVEHITTRERRPGRDDPIECLTTDA
ncbi:MAG: NAD(P)-binding domain-containing protein [Actinomycetota bacterium]